MDMICDQTTGVNITTNSIIFKPELGLNYDQLELLSESNPERVFSLLIKIKNLKNILNKCADISVLIHLTNIFSKIKLLKISKMKTIILKIIHKSKYLENLNNCLVDVNILEDLMSEIKLQKFLTSCKSMLEFMVKPKSRALLVEIIQSLQSICNESSLVVVEKLKFKDTTEIDKIVQMFKNVKITKCFDYGVERWPQIYKELSIYPETKDITSKKVILSQNIMKGSYESVEHYLDVQFRLLREDFIAPMREGIQYFIEMKKANEDIKKIPNMHVYFQAKIKKSKKNGEIFYKVNFYTKEDCSFDSKRFMTDSLLVFSDDNFNSMFFATVINMYRANQKPSKTLLINPLSEITTIKFDSMYTMAESDTYFLPYMYTMNVLDQFNNFNFPMKSYIIYGKTKPNIPAYLFKSKMYSINGVQFNILNDNLWPNNKDLGLDIAQNMAFKAALTKEFVVIQGPPGTGKTFIGLKIAKSIIENMYKKNVLINPIVVVCYTNHALDQFLEGLLCITKKILRIGGGCKSEALKPYIFRKQDDLDKLFNGKYVVGLTTTGASMRRDLLLDLKPPIVIVEEAAEVLESHVVSSLTKFCQHVILIGDHKQLRPRTASFTLAKKFNFDVSLFERLVENGFPCYTLTTQHRMRPEISTIIQPIYPFLKDHESVKNRSNIRGVTKCVYFIHHEVREEKVFSSNSYKNIHEIKFFMEFARYLLSQGYHQNQITILVTYREQLLELQKIRENSCRLEDFRIECVDGYQGEENDIILLSLVRNNIDNNIGFLNIQNRICVALSRARNGLYIMGNMDNLIHSSIWKKISNKLVKQQSLGNKLTLHCEFHNNWITTVSDSSDFSKVRCLEVCNMIMDCGHRCLRFCHYYDQSHKTLYRCKKLYPKTLPCGFQFKIECWMKYLTFKCPK